MKSLNIQMGFYNKQYTIEDSETAQFSVFVKTGRQKPSVVRETFTIIPYNLRKDSTE